MDIALFTSEGLDFLVRWLHFLAGITWIGLLYYFNFIQGEYFKEAEDAHKSGAIQKLVPRALWWFRWGAMFTFLTGIVLLGSIGKVLTVDIAIGATLGTLMFLNVWLIIWPKQKIVIASATQVAEGGEALPAAAGAASKAALASRTNTLFSLPMLFFMGSSAHMANGYALDETKCTALAVALGIVLLLEANAIFGKQGPMTKVSGVIHCGIGLTAILYAAVAML